MSPHDALVMSKKIARLEREVREAYAAGRKAGMEEAAGMMGRGLRWTGPEAAKAIREAAK